jgi:hypothetical protein
MLFMINDENIDQIEPDTLTRKFNSLKFRSVDFWQLSDFQKMIESADELCLVCLNEGDIHDILQICKTPLNKVEIIEPECMVPTSKHPWHRYRNKTVGNKKRCFKIDYR